MNGDSIPSALGLDFGTTNTVVALSGQCRVGASAGIFDRAPDDHAAWARIQPATGMSNQPLKEQAAEILETECFVEDHRPLEQRARGDALERLDEAAVEWRLKIFADRPWPCLMRDAVPAAFLLPKA